MRAVDLIYAKRMGEALAPGSIRHLIHDYVAGGVPDYQMAAWLMAVYFQGLSGEELQALTEAMMRSGDIFDFSSVPAVKADKHSTGGVGDKVSLILAPLAAACGLAVPMIAGRGLGHTGGTIDKLEAIPGFRTRLTQSEIERLLGSVGAVIAAQTDQFVPADKKLYALRDVTATVESIPLIAASIMSKKLAEGADALILDVKVGDGAFMKDEPSARRLAETMIGIGRSMKRKVEALLTDMNQPTGWAVGNANEVIESIECLKGNWPADLKEVTLALTARMLIMGGVATSEAEARAMMERTLGSGAALEKFRQMIEAQGGEPRVIDDYGLLPTAPEEAVITAPRAGWVAGFRARQIGVAAAILGAGRRTKEDAIDPGVGVWAHAKIGDRVEKGQPVFTVRYRQASLWAEAEKMLMESLFISEEPTAPATLILAELAAH